jgi:hypothetical protein
VVRVLNQIYEVDFLGFSYGFRPKRSQHDVLDALWVGLMRKKVNWVLEGVTTGPASSSLLYFAVEPHILVLDVESPEVAPFPVEIGPS